MANTIKLLFWVHHSKRNSNGMVPLKIRLTLKNNRAERSTGHYIKPSQWNPHKQRVRGSSDDANFLNGWIEQTGVQLKEMVLDLSDEEVHLPTLLEKLLLTSQDRITLVEYITEFVDKLKTRVGRDYTWSTYEKYVFTKNKILSFLKLSAAGKNLLLKDVSVKLIMDFDHYLRVVEDNQHNTAVKYCLNLKRMINIAVLQGLLPSNPFTVYKTVYKDTPQTYLIPAELQEIEKLELSLPRLVVVRDLFLFQCYTGLAYTDLFSLTAADVSIDHHGREWIIKARQKSGITSTIPLLQPAKEILEKYRATRKSNKLLPCYSIQKYNEYLKEIGTLAGITKKVSSHSGRRTFGSIALSNGISINVISKILGHSNTIITQRIYAITTQEIISNEIVKFGFSHDQLQSKRT